MTKTKLARKLMSQEEIKKGVPKFQSQNWNNRKEGIATKLANKITKVKARKIERLAKLSETEVIAPNKIAKLSTAEQKQLRRKVKITKFKNKFNNLLK